MSKYLKPCPVCGKNDWKVVSATIRELAMPVIASYGTEYCNLFFSGEQFMCLQCATIIQEKHIDDRVMQWVPVAERLPDKDGYYIVKKAVTHSLKYDTCKFKDGKWFLCWEGCETRSARAVTHWLDDHTFDKEKS